MRECGDNFTSDQRGGKQRTNICNILMYFICYIYLITRNKYTQNEIQRHLEDAVTSFRMLIVIGI